MKVSDLSYVWVDKLCKINKCGLNLMNIDFEFVKNIQLKIILLKVKRKKFKKIKNIQILNIFKKVHKINLKIIFFNFFLRKSKFESHNSTTIFSVITLITKIFTKNSNHPRAHR